jgi:hypothetical protein
MLAFGNINVVERARQQVSTVFIRGKAQMGTDDMPSLEG